MDERKENLRTGLFIAAGFLLLLGMLFFFGMSKIFSAESVTAVTVFQESVQGLNKGAAVKFRGVPIGTVTKISIRGEDNLIVVEMALDLDDFIDRNGGDKGFSKEEFVKFIHAKIKKGLRCRLEYAGITGMQFINFDFFANPESAVPRKLTGIALPQELYVPSVKSAIKHVMASVNTSLERLAKVDFERISGELGDNLALLKKLLGDPAIRQSIASISKASQNFEKASGSINAVLDEKKIKELTKLLEEDLVIIRQLGSRMDSSLAASKLPESAESLRQAADAVSDGKAEMTVTLLKLHRTLDSLDEFLRNMTDDPGALVHGRNAAPLKFKKGPAGK